MWYGFMKGGENVSNFKVYNVGGVEYKVPLKKCVDDSRYWEFIVYPDSAPSDWLWQLDMTGLKVAISPYHDMDIIEGTTDEKKKPHYHVLCCWENKTTFKHALAFSSMLNCPYPDRKDNLQGAFEYHTHKNHADKFQYDDKDRRFLNGLTRSDIVKLSQDDIRSITKAVCSLIRNLCIFEYGALIEYLLDNELDQYFDYVTTHTIFFDRYISSRRYAGCKAKIVEENKNENE